MMTSQAADIFRQSLLPHERILWTGQPKLGLALSARDTFLVPFSLFFFGFVVLWNTLAWTIPAENGGIDWFFPLFGSVFLLAGFYVLIGRFFHDAAIRRRLAYAVTDQRILISRRSPLSSKISSLDIHRLPRLELTEYRDGTGTLTFEQESINWFTAAGGLSWWLPSAGTGMQFFRVPQPRTVYDLIRRQTAA